MDNIENDDMKFYILTPNKEIRVATDDEYFGSFDRGSCRVAQTNLPKGKISTVFIGVGDCFFETMAFGFDIDDEYQVRTSTFDEALKAHNEAVEKFYDAPIS